MKEKAPWREPRGWMVSGKGDLLLYRLDLLRPSCWPCGRFPLGRPTLLAPPPASAGVPDHQHSASASRPRHTPDSPHPLDLGLPSECLLKPSTTASGIAEPPALVRWPVHLRGPIIDRVESLSTSLAKLVRIVGCLVPIVDHLVRILNHRKLHYTAAKLRLESSTVQA